MRISEKFGTKLVKNLKRIALGAASLLVMSIVFTSPQFKTTSAESAAGGATAPKFNFLQGDKEMLQGARVTDSAWSDPVNANIGDRVSVLFYYHNGYIDTVAHHTTLRVDIPANQGTSFNLKSYLWADGLQAINDTVVNGQIVGNSGLTINLPSTGRLEYVPNSTQWFPEASKTGQFVPDAIASVSGLDIGDVAGCWEHSGYVSFLLDVKGQAKLVLDKKVAHPGDASWQYEITASRGDQVAYFVGVRNDGADLAQNVLVKDILPPYMEYIPGTTYMYTKDHQEGVKQSDGIFGDGLTLPNMTPGEDGRITLTYKTKIISTIPNEQCSHYLNNIAKVYMGGVEQDMGQAKVTVRCESKLLYLDKTVRSGADYVKQNSVGLGGQVDYRIIVRNDGNVALTNVTVKDVLPIFVNYIPGSSKINGTVMNDQIISENGIDIGTLQPGESKTIMLSGKVYGCPPVGGYPLHNTAYALADTVTQIWDTASTIINVEVPDAPIVK